MSDWYGGIEAGGTKFVCAVGRGPGEISDEIRFATTTPEETIGRVIEFFRAHHACQPLAAIGIGAFGPVGLDPAAPDFGFITTTPKPGWRNVDLRGAVARALDLPVGFDTDVNAAAMGEHLWGAGQGLRCFIYMTVGTGIGGGAVIEGRPLHGLIHPEMGHMRIPHDRQADPFEGGCPYHGDCLEGLASGRAMELRWGRRAETLPADHPGWALEARYLALAAANLVCTLSPQRLILGGGVPSHPGLLERVRRDTLELLGGYVQAPAVLGAIDSFIVPPALGNHAGVLGALALARQAARVSQPAGRL